MFSETTRASFFPTLAYLYVNITVSVTSLSEVPSSTAGMRTIIATGLLIVIVDHVVTARAVVHYPAEATRLRSIRCRLCCARSPNATGDLALCAPIHQTIMDTLPLETTQWIFELACTDGGHTGHALSLVSSHFHTVARKTRFHSVALAASPRRLQAFVGLYERECDALLGDRPRIRHLHVTFPCISGQNASSRRGGPSSRSRSLSPQPSNSSREINLPNLPVADDNLSSTSSAQPVVEGHLFVQPSYRSLVERPAPDPTASPEYISAAQTLFRLVTPDLLTLVVQCGFTCGGELTLPVIHGPFPRLREATFVGLADFRALFNAVLPTDGLTETPLFPALTRLSLTPFGKWRYDPALAFWSTAAPRVTHLSVADAEGWAGALASAVGVRVWEEPPPRTFLTSIRDGPLALARPPPAATFPTVRHLLMRPGTGPLRAVCGKVWSGYHARVRTLKRVEHACQGVGVEALVLPAPIDEDYLRVHYTSIRRGWLERVQDERDGAG
ncbi:hypothetical protein BC628DRAFT_526836 [Trametes gibbosa]|nr:hypothetical protein BC628DRAFT_526836 [Trametes gibbosa]